VSQLEQVAAFGQTGTEDPNSSFGDLDVTVSIRRSFAGLFDLGIMGVLLVSLLHSYGLVAHTFDIHLSPPALFDIPHENWVLTVFYLKPVGMLLFVAIFISYFTVFEATFGWTPGKLLFGIRVVDFFGGTPTVGQALVRNTFRILDTYPYVVPNLVGLAILLSNRRRQRGGDKAAGTLVVDRRASSAVKTVRKWKQQNAIAELALPEEVWT